MKVTKITDNTSCIELHKSLVGIYYLTPHRVVLIDTGRDKSKDFIAWLKSEKLEVAAIINTHLHPDHIANTKAILKNWPCPVYAAEREVATTRSGHALAREYGLKLHSGIYMLLWHTHGYQVIDENRTTLTIEGAEFSILPLYGHSSGHIGVVTPDYVCHTGDALLSRDQIETVRMPVHFFIDEALASVATLKETDYPYYIMSHCGVADSEEFHSIVDLYLKVNQTIFDLILEKADKPISRKDLTNAVMSQRGIYRKKSSLWNACLFHVLDCRIDSLLKKGLLADKDGKLIRA